MGFEDDFDTPPTRAMSGPRDPVCRFQEGQQARRPDPALARIRAYWEALRDGRAVPMRAEINPRGLETALDRALMLERVAEGVARVRLAGSHATALMGMEVRGMPLSAMINPEARDGLAEALKAVFEGPSIAEFMLDARRGLGRPALSGRMTILPVMSEDGRIDRALGYLGAEGVIGRTPRRFDITMTRLIPLGDVEGAHPLIPGAMARPDDAAQAPAGFAEPQAAFETAADLRPRPGRPHLRLVKTDRR